MSSVLKKGTTGTQSAGFTSEAALTTVVNFMQVHSCCSSSITVDASFVSQSLTTRETLSLSFIVTLTCSMVHKLSCSDAQPRGVDTRGMSADKMREILGSHPDFKNEKSSIERFLEEEKGGIVYMLPKFHCEFNPIE